MYLFSKSLSNFYFNCLFKLLKFKGNDDVNLTNKKLESLGLHSFQHLLLIRLSTFIHKIVNNDNSPAMLKN